MVPGTRQPKTLAQTGMVTPPAMMGICRMRRRSCRRAMKARKRIARSVPVFMGGLLGQRGGLPVARDLSAVCLFLFF